MYGRRVAANDTEFAWIEYAWQREPNVTSKTSTVGRSQSKRARGPRRRGLISRLEVLLEKQVEQLETGQNEHTPDKEIALLGTLARTLEKLIELDENQSPPKSEKKTETAEMKQLREKLSDRIKNLEFD